MAPKNTLWTNVLPIGEIQVLVTGCKSMYGNICVNHAATQLGSSFQPYKLGIAKLPSQSQRRPPFFTVYLLPRSWKVCEGTRFTRIGQFVQGVTGLYS